MRKKKEILELISASEHVYYEFSMLVSSHNFLFIENEQNLKNIFLEAFVIHMRVLVGFFYSKDPRSDDIIAEDYIDNAHDWEMLRPEMSEKLKHAIVRVGKEIAHLSYYRITIEEMDRIWNHQELFEEMCKLMKIFINNADSKKINDSLQTNISINSQG